MSNLFMPIVQAMDGLVLGPLGNNAVNVTRGKGIANHYATDEDLNIIFDSNIMSSVHEDFLELLDDISNAAFHNTPITEADLKATLESGALDPTVAAAMVALVSELTKPELKLTTTCYKHHKGYVLYSTSIEAGICVAINFYTAKPEEITKQ